MSDSTNFVKDKRNILMVPAWYPSTFIQEPIALMAEYFDCKILVGERNVMGKKKALKGRLRGAYLPFSVEKQQGYTKVGYNYINSLPHKSQVKQLKRISDRIGNEIVNLFDGSLPDLIHFHSISDTAVFVSDWAKRNQIPFVITEHILYVRHSCDSFSRLKEKVFDEAEKVFCVSNYLYRNLLTTGFKMKQVAVVGNLVSDNYIPNNFYNTPRNGRIMFVAGHIADKDIETLLSTAKELQLNNNNIVIDIFGLSGEEYYNTEETLKEVVLKNELENCIKFKGKKTHKDLFQEYTNYSMLLSTSISETFGLSVAEAIASGTPVVCTDSGGIRDFVSQANGLIVPISNSKLLAAAVEEVFENYHNYNRALMSKEIIEKFGIEKFKQDLIKSYIEIMN